MVTSVRHQSTMPSPFNTHMIPSTSSATRSVGSLPVPSASATLMSVGSVVPNSPVRPPTTRLAGSNIRHAANKQPILGSLLSSTGPSTPPSQLQLRAPTTGPQLMSPSGQLTPGTSLPFLTTSTVTTASHTAATLGQVVRPVLAAVLRPQTGGGVQLVLNQQSNAAFMTGGVIVQVCVE